jgi:hypothetical protein
MEKLEVQGCATDHIWAMEHTIDGQDVIGLRFDCGDAGTLYLTKYQAREVIGILQTFTEGV